MKEIHIDLTLRFTMPEEGLNVNGALMGLRGASPKIFFALLEAPFSAVEKQTIKEMQKKLLERYIRNGYQSGMRRLRTSLGPFQNS